jgi:hypothetical protein
MRLEAVRESTGVGIERRAARTVFSSLVSDTVARPLDQLGINEKVAERWWPGMELAQCQLLGKKATRQLLAADKDKDVSAPPEAVANAACDAPPSLERLKASPAHANGAAPVRPLRRRERFSRSCSPLTLCGGGIPLQGVAAEEAQWQQAGYMLLSALVGAATTRASAMLGGFASAGGFGFGAATDSLTLSDDSPQAAGSSRSAMEDHSSPDGSMVRHRPQTPLRYVMLGYRRGINQIFIAV